MTRLLPAGFGAILAALSTPPILSAAPTDRGPLGAGLTAPAVFAEEVPGDLSGLRAMQAHQRALAEGLRQRTCTILVGPSSGSGEFISPEGLIASVAHVTLAPGTMIEIILADGTVLEGVSLAGNPELDGSFAMVLPDQLEEPLPWIELAPAGEHDCGDWCLAAGNSGGWDAERGSVVRVGRLVRVDDEVIQSDTPLIGGDSGGPLVDIHGRLIGSNSRVGMTARYSLHVPLDYYLGDLETAREMAALVRDEGVEAFRAAIRTGRWSFGAEEDGEDESNDDVAAADDPPTGESMPVPAEDPAAEPPSPDTP